MGTLASTEVFQFGQGRWGSCQAGETTQKSLTITQSVKGKLARVRTEAIGARMELV
jgi:hypothetical protein